ncbi:MAG TPA: hypothetical protein VHQ47_18490 [Phycisphaerae bacterium]|nr:hypothetical protein [Phycisphaerae bacterium]
MVAEFRVIADSRTVVAGIGLVVVLAYVAYSVWLRTEWWESLILTAVAGAAAAVRGGLFGEQVLNAPLNVLWHRDYAAQWITVIGSDVAILLGVGWLWRLYAAWILGRMSGPENMADMRGIRAWLGPANMLMLLIFAGAAWVGLGWPFWLTAICGVAALAAYPVVHAMAGGEGAAEVLDPLAEERRRVLTLVEMGKISGEDAAELIAALGPAPARARRTGRGFSVGRRLMTVGALLLVAAFFVPWFAIPVSEVMRFTAATVGGIAWPATLPPVGRVEVHAGDVAHGMGWVILALGALPALLPWVWPAEEEPAAAQRGITLAGLAVGSLMLLYLFAEGSEAAAAGVYLALGAYGVVWAGAVRQFVRAAPSGAAALA